MNFIFFSPSIAWFYICILRSPRVSFHVVCIDEPFYLFYFFVFIFCQSPTTRYRNSESIGNTVRDIYQMKRLLFRIMEPMFRWVNESNTIGASNRVEIKNLFEISLDEARFRSTRSVTVCYGPCSKRHFIPRCNTLNAMYKRAVFVGKLIESDL